MDYQLSNPDNSLKAVIENIVSGTSHLSFEEQQEILMQVVNSHTKLDLPYLRCLYFPESSCAARVPTKFPVPTGVVTQKFSFYLNTGATGAGFVGMCPQDTTYMPCFYSANGLPNKAGSHLGEDCSIKFIGETSNYLPANFSHARLVGASMQISWIGQADQESGFLCSSHLFDSAPVCLSENLIEEGFYPIRTVPSKGIRLVYIPKDDSDTEFAQLNYQLVYVKGNDMREELDITYDVKTWFDRPRRAVDPDQAKGNQIMGDGQSDLQPLQLEITDSVSSKQLVWANVPPQNQIAPNCYYGLHKNKGSYGMPNMMICYWKGLPTGKDWLRVDVVRHFEVLPRQHVKDLVSVARTKPSNETMNHVSNGSGEMADSHNSTIEDLSKFDHYSGSQMRTMLKDGLVTQGQFDAVNTSRHGNTSGPHEGVTSSLPGLIQGRDMRMQNATMNGLQLASSLFDFLPSAWLDKPLLSLLRRGVNYAAQKGATQGGGNLFGLSQGTPSYTKLVLQ